MTTATETFGINDQRVRVSHLRLTGRGRSVLTALVSVPLVLAALTLAINGGGALGTDTAGTPLHYVTVHGGESLWQLANSVAPGADPRDVVSDIVHLNQLSTTDIQAGQQLAIPAQYGH